MNQSKPTVEECLQLMFEGRTYITKTIAKSNDFLENGYTSRTEMIAINSIVPNSRSNRDDCVDVFQNMIFESDGMSEEDTRKVLSTLSFPYSVLIYSGGKSTHIWLSFDTPFKTSIEYQKMWLRIHTLLSSQAERLGLPKGHNGYFDPSTKNVGNLTRFPNTIRSSTGKEQTLLEVNGKVKLKNVEALLSARAIPIMDFTKDKDLRKSIPIDLEDRKKYAKEYLEKSGETPLDTEGGRSNQLFNLASKVANDFAVMAPDGKNIADVVDILAEYYSNYPGKTLYRTDRDEFTTVISNACRYAKYSYGCAYNDYGFMPESKFNLVRVQDFQKKMIEEAILISEIRDSTNTYAYIEKDDDFFEFDRTVLGNWFANKKDRQAWESVRNVLSFFEYEPKRPRLWHEKCYNFFNLYKEPAWKKGEQLIIAELPDAYKKFFNHLFANDKDSVDFALDWISTALRQRNMTYLTLIGEEGVGKGLLGLIMKALVGDKNFVETRDEVLKHRFNAQLANKQIIYIDEMQIQDDSARDKLKALANEFIEVEEKGRNSKTVKNFASVYITSNKLNAVPLSGDDRRFSILKISNVKLREVMTVEEIENLYLNQELIAQLGSFLMHRTVSRDMRVPFFDVETKSRVRLASLQRWQQEILDVDFMKSHTSEPLDVVVDVSILKDELRRSTGYSPTYRELEEFCRQWSRNLLWFRDIKDNNKRKIKLISKEELQ